MQYSHRNGETEPPTVKGWYWFRGTVDGEPYADSVTIMKVIWGDELRAIGQERVSPYLYYWQGEWYGPIVAPWDDNPAPSEAMVGVDGLLPCPFCGSQSVEIDNSDTSNASWAYCNGCGARSAASSDDSKVIAAWNKRALQRRPAGEGV